MWSVGGSGSIFDQNWNFGYVGGTPSGGGVWNPTLYPTGGGGVVAVAPASNQMVLVGGLALLVLVVVLIAVKK